MSVRCFLLEPTDILRRGYRRYASGPDKKCTKPFGYHNARLPLDEVQAIWREDDGGRSLQNCYSASDFDPKAFPSACECGYAFGDADERQIFTELLWRRADNGALTTLREAAPGAMWDAWWLPGPWWKGADGRSLMVKLPNGHEWCIDSRASNCTMPKDTEHKCWVRHGEPPNITVDKNGKTCAAGAGSIQSGDYHGFLRGGVFQP